MRCLIVVSPAIFLPALLTTCGGAHLQCPRESSCSELMGLSTCSLMNAGSLIAIVACVISMACSACAPIPSTTPVAPRTGGFVLDANSKQPVPGARVTAERAGFHAAARTSGDGFYSIPALKQWHFLCYLGSPGIAPTPWIYRDPKARYTVTAAAPGYQSASQTFEGFPISAHRPFDLQMPRSVNFQLRRTQP